MYVGLGFGCSLGLGVFVFVYTTWWWSGMLFIVHCRQLTIVIGLVNESIVLYSSPGCFFIGLSWSGLFMMVFVGLVCLWWSAPMVQHVYVGVLWCSGLVWCGYGGVQWSWALVLGFFNTWPFKVFSAATSHTMFDFTDKSFLLWSWWCSGCVALLSS